MAWWVEWPDAVKKEGPLEKLVDLGGMCDQVCIRESLVARFWKLTILPCQFFEVIATQNIRN